MSVIDFEAYFPFLMIAGVCVFLGVFFLLSMQRGVRNKRKIAAVATKLGLDFQDSGQALSTRAGREAVLQRAGDGRVDREALRQAEQSGVLNFVLKILSGLGPWEITGEYMGSGVTIRPIQTGSGRNKKTYTRFEMRFANPLPVGLHISKEGFLDRVGKTIFGAQDIEVARSNTGATRDETARRFDEIARVKSKTESEALGERGPENRIRSLLQDAQIQNAVIEVLSEFPDTEIEETGLTLDIRGTLTDDQKYRAVLDRFAACARAFGGRSFL